MTSKAMIAIVTPPAMLALAPASSPSRSRDALTLMSCAGYMMAQPWHMQELQISNSCSWIQQLQQRDVPSFQRLPGSFASLFYILASPVARYT